MPRYFFDMDGSSNRDSAGTELPDHHTARREAIKYAASVISKDPDLALKNFRVEVRDASEQRLYVILIAVFDASKDESLLKE